MTGDLSYQSGSYFIVANELCCLDCFATTRVWGFALPDGTMPYFIRDLSRNAIEQMQRFTSSYYLDKDQTTGKAYWMNHCSECKAQLDEIDIFEASKTNEGPFGSDAPEGSEHLQMQEFNRPFQAWADDKLRFWLLTKDDAL
jgi:hypothetical protein